MANASDKPARKVNIASIEFFARDFRDAFRCRCSMQTTDPTEKEPQRLSTDSKKMLADKLEYAIRAICCLSLVMFVFCCLLFFVLNSKTERRNARWRPRFRRCASSCARNRCTTSYGAELLVIV